MLGIGANSAMFSVVNAVLIKPLPYPDADRIVILGYTFNGNWVPWTSEAKFNIWRNHSATFDQLAGVRFQRVGLDDGRNADQIESAHVSAAFFSLFGAALEQGRAFTAAEDAPSGAPVVVLSHGFWRRHFGGDPGALGSRLTIDGTSSVVIGILGRGFDTTIFGVAPDVLMPLHLDPRSTSHPPTLMAAARLRPAVTLAAADADARSTGGAFRRAFPEAMAPTDTFAVAPFRNVMVDDVRWSLLVLMGAVVLVLCIACVNLANLLVARAAVRQREFAVRCGIGASRGRIVRQLLTESLALAVAGGGLGCALGIVGVRVLVALNPEPIPGIGATGSGTPFDWRVLVVTATASMMTALLFGVAPAWQAARTDLTLALASHGQPVRRVGARSGRLVLLTAELALALMLLVGSALLLRTFVLLRSTDRGFDTHDVMIARMPLKDPRFATTSAVARLVADARERLGSQPGIVAAAASVSLPLESDWMTSFRIVGRTAPTASTLLASERIVSAGYLDVFRIPVIKGRAFGAPDDLQASPVALINQTMARQFWAAADPFQDQVVLFPGVTPEDDPPRAIVGIVADVRDGSPLNREVRPTVYVPITQVADRLLHAEPLAWVVRFSPHTAPPEGVIKRELRTASGGLGATNVRTMASIQLASTSRTWFATVLMTTYGTIALLVAAIGVFGVTAYFVEQRRREIGIRIAIGATANDVRKLVLAQGLVVIACGIAIGFAGAWALSRVLENLLFGVTTHDPLAFALAALVLAAVAAIATLAPAQRAAQLNPLDILRMN